MPPLNAEMTALAACEGELAVATLPPTKMPCPAAEIVPELLMPPAKLDIAATPSPPLVVATTAIPSDPEIVPEFVMPPTKVDTVIVPCLVPVPPTKIRDRDAAGRSAADNDAGA
jgi:hypothetical protein